MDDKRIVFDRGDGTVGVLIPCAGSGLTIQDIANKDIPPWAAYAVVDASALPADQRYAAAWVADLSADPVVVTVDPTKKAAIDRQLAVVELEQWFSDKLQEGFSTGQGWKLGMTQADITLLTGNYVLSKEAAALGLPIPPVIDSAGGTHQLDMDDLTQLMLEYGQARATLSAEYAARKAAIAQE